jgi:hypothetical protein
MDALAEVCNEEIHLCDVGLLQSATVLDARSSIGRSLSARPVAPVALASPSVIPPTARGDSVGLQCDHCDRDGHVEAFCYRKKKAQKAQARRSSQGTGGTGSGDLRGVLLIQRHRRFSCCFVALWPLCHQELLVL